MGTKRVVASDPRVERALLTVMVSYADAGVHAMSPVLVRALVIGELDGYRPTKAQMIAAKRALGIRSETLGRTRWGNPDVRWRLPASMSVTTEVRDALSRR